jgi:hypothetical protein
MAAPELKLSPRELRARHEELILADILGPAGGDHEELCDAPPKERYVVGKAARRCGH